MLSNDYNDDLYTMYHNDVGKHPILTHKEERELFKRYHTCPHCSRKIKKRVVRTNCPCCGSIVTKRDKGRMVTCTTCSSKFDKYEMPKSCRWCASKRDLEARELLIVSNLRFVIKRAKKLTTDNSRRRLLISAGNVGLMLAVDKYDPDHGTRFLTYAEWWIRKEMYDAINSSPLVHIPPQKRKMLLKELKEGKYVCIKCGVRTDAPHADTYAPCTEGEHVFEKPDMATSSLLGNGVSLDQIKSVEDQVDDSGEALDEGMRKTIRTVLSKMSLSERDKYIVTGYYDATQPDRRSEPKNLGQLSAMLGVTPERVRQLKTGIMRKVKRELQRNAINGVCD